MINLITEHIDIWTTAQTQKTNGGRGRGNGSANQSPHGIKKLRELILELAVRGKLVAQDPNDEPASELLKKIAKEKTRLIKEGKINKEIQLPEIDEAEKPFELPKEWQWARLQDITTYIQRGKGPEYADQGKIKVISQKCIQWSGFDLSKARFIDDYSLNVYQPERFLQCNDLLWNSTGTGTVGRIIVLREVESKSLVADSHVTIIRPLQVSSDFLWCYMAAPVIQRRIEPENENSLVSGTTKQVELNTGAIKPLLIPIPPLAEQLRIVAKVDELMALCDYLEQKQTDSNAAHQILVETLLATLTRATDKDEFIETWERIAENFDTLFTTEHSIAQLKQTILQLAVMGKLVPQDPNDEPASALIEKIAKEKARLIKEGKRREQSPLLEISEDEKPFDLPPGWEWARPDDFSQKITDGEHFRPQTKDQGVYFLSAKDIRADGVSLDDPLYVSPKTAKAALQRCNPEKGDILIVSRGATVGRMCTVDIDDVFCLLGSVILIKPISPMLSDYLKVVMKTPQAFEQLVSASGSTAQPAIYLRDLKKIVFPIAPLTEQRRIVTKVDELMALCDKLKARLKDAQITQVQLADTIVEQAVA